MVDLAKVDKKLIWHPITQEKIGDLPLLIKAGRGPYLVDRDNKKYLDLISSWWVNLHGHANPYIAHAIYEQALKLEQVIFAGFSHEPAINLCSGLQKILPATLKRFFFSDNGSSATEIAIKMAFQYWVNQKIYSKKAYISFMGGYHGDTIGAMSVGQSPLHRTFGTLLFNNHHIPFPQTWDGDQDVAFKEEMSLNALQTIINQLGSEIIALMVEPLVQGANGMQMCRPSFLEAICKRTREAGILVIFDEVMTGFGRTGKNFAFEHINFVPDILCLAKGLTGGFLPLALTVVTEQLFEAFLGDNMQVAFTHSHSYTANPLGCAAAIASLALLLKDETIKNIHTIKKANCIGIEKLRSRTPKLEKFRQMGTIAAFDMVLSDEADPFKTSLDLRKKFIEAGYLIRPLGKTIYVLPPYCSSLEQLEQFYEYVGNYFDR